MRVGVWNVRSLYRPGSLKTEAAELAKYRLDSDGTTEATNNQRGMLFLYGKGNESHLLGTGLYVQKTTSAVKSAEFVSDSTSYIVLGGRWCDIFCRHMSQLRINVMIQMTISMRN